MVFIEKSEHQILRELVHLEDKDEGVINILFYFLNPFISFHCLISHVSPFGLRTYPQNVFSGWKGLDCSFYLRGATTSGIYHILCSGQSIQICRLGIKSDKTISSNFFER